MSKPLIIANWKMNPASRAAARRRLASLAASLRGVRGVEVAVAPPFLYLADAARLRRAFRLAAQDVFWEAAGPYTGAVSAPMLRDLGVTYVIIGHSERRRIFGESNEDVNRKAKAAIAAGLVPVIAIGEEALESNEVVPSILFRQLSEGLLGIPRRKLAGAVIAYEPVRAISTSPASRPDAPDQATRRAIYIRKLLTKILGRRVADTIRIIYGGSVKAKNAAGFISADIRGMEGLLVGGASLDGDEFVAIVRALGPKNAS